MSVAIFVGVILRLIFALSALTIIAAHVAKADTIQPSVNGVTLGMSLEEVKSHLGAFQKETTSEPDGCTNLPNIELHYNGMLVTLAGQTGEVYIVTAIDVTSPKYSVGNIRIGDSAQKVKDTFGSPNLLGNALYYTFGESDVDSDGDPVADRGVGFTIRDGSVSEINMDLGLCY